MLFSAFIYVNIVKTIATLQNNNVYVIQLLLLSKLRQTTGKILPKQYNRPVKKSLNGNVAGMCESAFSKVEETYGKLGVTRLSSLITCSEYGLTEIELLELLMPTSNTNAVINTENGNFNFSSLCSVRRKLGKF